MLLEHIANQADLSLAPQGYRLGDIVGAGGMGVVYHLRTLADEPTDLVVKMVHPAISGCIAAEQQLQHEAEIEQRLKGLPHVVETLAYGQHSKGHGYKIMRSIQGISLKLWLQQNNVVNLQLRLFSILPILRQLIIAVEMVHKQNILHGDLKPDNILLHHHSDYLRLFDFGLAQYCNKVSNFKVDYQAYSPFYSSPRVLAGFAPEIKDDVYSLAMIFWEMLLGRESLQNRTIPSQITLVPHLQHFFNQIITDNLIDLEFLQDLTLFRQMIK